MNLSRENAVPAILHGVKLINICNVIEEGLVRGGER